MKCRALDFLCCPACRGTLTLLKKREGREEILSGSLHCGHCSAEYPIHRRRPILMSKTSIHEWLAPIDEALNLQEHRNPKGPLSLLRLQELGRNPALERSRATDTDSVAVSVGVSESLERMKGKIEYIVSGRWLEAMNRAGKLSRMLESPGVAVSAFIELVVSRKADSLLDVASGGGSGVVSIADAVGESVEVFAAERDLKCLWIIQSKSRAIGRDSRFEAVGADVRCLPFRDGSIGTVTSMMALQEIMGISRLLKEIKRVLVPGGSYIALANREPWVYGVLPLDHYKSFARENDLYSGQTDLLLLAERIGLKVSEVRQYGENGKELCLMELGKPE